MKLGSWEYNNVGRDMFVAYDWHMVPPTDFWDLPKKDQAIMIAVSSARSSMMSYEEEQMASAPRRKSGPSASPPPPRRVRYG